MQNHLKLMSILIFKASFKNEISLENAEIVFKFIQISVIKNGRYTEPFKDSVFILIFKAF